MVLCQHISFEVSSWNDELFVSPPRIDMHGSLSFQLKPQVCFHPAALSSLPLHLSSSAFLPIGFPLLEGLSEIHGFDLRARLALECGKQLSAGSKNVLQQSGRAGFNVKLRDDGPGWLPSVSKSVFIDVVPVNEPPYFSLSPPEVIIWCLIDCFNASCTCFTCLQRVVVIPFLIFAGCIAI
jgi:hypothetical protein